MLKRLFKRANNETQPEPPSVGESVAQPRVDEVVEKPRVIRKLILGVLGVGSVLILLGYNFKETGDRNDSLFLEGGSTMVLEPVECPVCGGTNVIKHGKSGEL